MGRSDRPRYTATREDKKALKVLTNTLYMTQRLRIATANRVASHVRQQLGQEPGMPTSEISPEAQRLLTRMKLEYGKISTAIAHLNMDRLRGMLDDTKGVIATPYQYAMIKQYVALEEQEAELSHEIAQLVKEFPLWTEWLEGVKGVGPVLASVLISELDPYIARRPSSFIKFCFPAGTLISTPNGMVAIEEIKAGDSVLDASGQPTMVKDAMERDFSGTLVTLDILGSLPLTMTEEHPMLVVRKGKQLWLQAGTIVAGDKVVLPSLQLRTDPQLTFDASNRAKAYSPVLSKPLSITPDIAYLLGRYVGDGSASTWVVDAIKKRGIIQVAFGHDEQDEAETYLGQVRDAFGSGWMIKGPETYRVGFGSGTLSWLFKDLFGYKAHAKKIPDVIMGLTDQESIKSFLRGYFDADGHVVKEGKSAGSILASSASVGLILQIQSLLTKLGVFGAVHRQLRGASQGVIQGHAFTQRDERFILSIPKSQTGLIYPDLAPTFNRTARKIESAADGWYLTVKRVLRSPVEDRKVYNLHTKSNTYLAQNIVAHNCGLDVVPTYQLPALAGSYTRTEETVTLHGAGVGLQGTKDQCHYLWRLSSGNATLAATLQQPAEGRTGLMLRYDCAPDAAFYALGVDGEGQLWCQWRKTAGAHVEDIYVGRIALPLHLEIARQGPRCGARLTGSDGAPVVLSQAQRLVKLGGMHCAGLWVSGSAVHAADATWTNLELRQDGGDTIGQTDEEWWGEDIGDPAQYVGGQGRSRRKEHLVKREYKAKDGTIKVRDSVTFSPFCKTKILGVLVPSFLKAGGPYAEIYYQYKHRLENHPKYGLAAEEAGVDGATKLHRHNMSVRFCAKRFLIDLHKKWREIEGLPVYPSYAEAKLHLHRDEPVPTEPEEEGNDEDDLETMEW